MPRTASLVVIDKATIIETAILSSREPCWRHMLPKRVPDKIKGKEAAWIIKLDRRRAFGKFVNKILEEYKDSYQEELYGFFGLVGIGTRWADNKDVIWCLYVGNRELEKGMKL